MKRIFLFILLTVLCLKPDCVKAQLLDDLFAEEEFEETTSNNETSKVETTSTISVPTPASNGVMPPALPAPTTTASPIATPAMPVATQAPVLQKPTAKLAVQPRPQPVIERTVLPTLKPVAKDTSALPSLGRKGSNMPSLGRAGDSSKSLSLFEMRAKNAGVSNPKVVDFNIAGVQLKMTPEEVLDVAEKAGFTVKFENKEVPDLNKWKYRRICMQKMIFTMEKNKTCIDELAEKNQANYTNRLVLENKQKKERLTVEFASNFAGNKAYYIRYINKGDHSLGTTKQADYFRSKRRHEFLSLLIKKYGVPDDEQTLLWGAYGVGATLKADLTDAFQDAILVLEDTSIQTEDFDNMSIADSKETTIRQFSF